MAATLTQERFTGAEWIFERKLDGIRLLAFKNGPEIRLLSRNRRPQTLHTIVEAIAEGRRPESMAQDEELVYDYVTELLATKGVSDKTYQRITAKFGEHGIVDITGIVGYYSLLAMQMNIARTPIPDGKPLPLPRFPL